MNGFSRSSVRAQCPFFEKEARLSITCEGLLYKTQEAVRFKTEDDRIAITEIFCKSNEWELCPRAKMLIQKYKE